MRRAPWLLFVGGCGGNDFQSALHPASAEARDIAELWWLMLGVYGAVFVITLLLTAIAVLRRRARAGAASEPPLGSLRFVVVAGVVVPTLVLFGMLILSLQASARMQAPATELTVEITGHLWWWDVRYPDRDIVTANEIRVPVGVPVRLELKSADVIHSFWVPNLHGKMDMVPEHMNRFWLRADRPGVYRGICAEFCGDQHAHMGIDVIALEPEAFAAWVEASRSMAPPSESRGKEVFFDTGCSACHAIRNTEAVATVGPDLTLLATRQNLGASSFPNTPENLTRWIVDPQTMKPGSLMPATEMTSEDLEALVTYLQSLR